VIVESRANWWRMPVRVAASTAAIGLVLTLGTGGALAATTLTLDPDHAAPGTTVTISNACGGITDNPPESLPAAFVNQASPGVQPDDPSVPRTVARAVAGSGNYTVTVPPIAPGIYDVRLECLPGDWRTNVAEGGAFGLTVLPGTPSTDTAQASDDQPSTDRLRVGTLLALAGLAGAFALSRRVALRPSRVRTSALVDPLERDDP
jgi:hypothetical protein